MLTPASAPLPARLSAQALQELAEVKGGLGQMWATVGVPETEPSFT